MWIYIPVPAIVSEVMFTTLKKQKLFLLSVIRNLSDFVKSFVDKLDDCDFEDRKKLVRLTVELVEVDSEKEEINVKHIIPMNPKKCQLRLGTLMSPT